MSLCQLLYNSFSSPLQTGICHTLITPAIKYPHYNYAIYGNDYLDHWQWFPLTYVYANEYNNFISKLARQLISREKINKLLPVFNFDSVESFIKKCELVEKGI